MTKATATEPAQTLPADTLDLELDALADTSPEGVAPLRPEPPSARVELTAIGLVCSGLGAVCGGLLPVLLGRTGGALVPAVPLPGNGTLAAALLCAGAGATAFGLFGTLIGWQLADIPVPFLESAAPEAAAGSS